MKVTGIQSSLAYKKMGAQKRGDFPQPMRMNCLTMDEISID